MKYPLAIIMVALFIELSFAQSSNHEYLLPEGRISVEQVKKALDTYPSIIEDFNERGYTAKFLDDGRYSISSNKENAGMEEITIIIKRHGWDMCEFWRTIPKIYKEYQELVYGDQHIQFAFHRYLYQNRADYEVMFADFKLIKASEFLTINDFR